jgi:hypothetical protein
VLAVDTAIGRQNASFHRAWGCTPVLPSGCKLRFKKGSCEELTMKKILVSMFAGAVLAGVSVAQKTESQVSGSASQASSVATGPAAAQTGANASSTASQASQVSSKSAQAAGASQLQAGSTVQAELVKPIDARKSKVGDEVLAKTTHDVKSEGRVVIPKGSKLVGHVTEVKAHSRDQAASELGIAFDHAILKNGSEMPLALGIQAIGRSQASAAAIADDVPMTGGTGAIGSSGARASGGGGMLGGVRSTAGTAVDSAGSTAGAAVNTAAGTAGGAASGSLSASSHGVIGLPGMSLSTQTSTSTNASVISSEGSNVHLDSGTEMILRINQ